MSDEPTRKRSPLPVRAGVVLGVLAVVAGLSLRLWLAARATHPGHADYAFYYTVARNVAEGRGLVVDYLWNYLNPYPDLTHPANHYWGPLTPLIIAGFQFVGGSSLFVSLLPSILFSLLLSGVTFLLARRLLDASAPAVLAALLTFLSPQVVRHSVVTDSAIYFAVFVNLFLWLILLSMRNPRILPVAFACWGLAYLTRQDAVLLFPASLAPLAFGEGSLRRKIGVYALSAATLLLVISPQLVSVYRAFGSITSPASGYIPFLREYEQVFAYRPEALDLSGFLAWGWENILASRVRGVHDTARTLFNLFGVLWAFAVLFAVSERARDRGARWAPILAYVATLAAFYAVVAPFVGSFGSLSRIGVALVPPMMTAVGAVIVDVLSYRRRHALVFSAAIGLVLLGRAYQSANATIERHQQIERRTEALEQILRSAAGEDYDETVVMTRSPWELHLSTGLGTLQVPYEGVETALEVADRFGADYLVLPARRPVLDAIAEGRARHPRLRLVASVPGSEQRLYEIVPDPSSPAPPREPPRRGNPTPRP